MQFGIYFGQYWSYGDKESRFHWAIVCCESIGSDLAVTRMKEVCVSAKIKGITGQKLQSSKSEKFDWEWYVGDLYAYLECFKVIYCVNNANVVLFTDTTGQKWSNLVENRTVSKVKIWIGNDANEVCK